jgi:hypothetical protein
MWLPQKCSEGKAQWKIDRRNHKTINKLNKNCSVSFAKRYAFVVVRRKYNWVLVWGVGLRMSVSIRERYSDFV